jgi:hypothetical protein
MKFVCFNYFLSYSSPTSFFADGSAPSIEDNLEKIYKTLILFSPGRRLLIFFSPAVQVLLLLLSSTPSPPTANNDKSSRRNQSIYENIVSGCSVARGKEEAERSASRRKVT